MKDEVKNSLEYWENIYKNPIHIENNTDDWLQNFDVIIQTCTTPILDLGCGNGNDTLYLLQKGKTVIPCDQSKNAINNIKSNFPKIKDTKCFNLLDGLPFENNEFELIIADLCLHYFREQDTFRILDDIYDKLKQNGHLLLRVNTVNDVNHGAGQGKEIGPHLYETKEGTIKRFFDAQDIKYYFKKFDIQYCKEKKMTRYTRDKMTYCVCVRKK